MNKTKVNDFKYLYLLQSEFEDVNDTINSIKNYKLSEPDVADASTIQKALDTTVVVSYTRNFTTSRGFRAAKRIQTLLKGVFDEGEVILHDKIMNLRNEEFVHSDRKKHKVQLIHDEMFTHSKMRARQPLEKKELELLSQMVSKIREKVTELLKIVE